MTMSPTILLFSPRVRGEPDLQTALEGQGWNVVRAASPRSFSTMLTSRPVDLVVFDDPPWDLVEHAISTLDTVSEPVPRLWLSSAPEAPGQSGRLGIDALLLSPVEHGKLVDHIGALLAPHTASSSGVHRAFPLGTNPPRAR